MGSSKHCVAPGTGLGECRGEMKMRGMEWGKQIDLNLNFLSAACVHPWCVGRIYCSKDEFNFYVTNVTFKQNGSKVLSKALGKAWLQNNICIDFLVLKL